MKSTAQCLPCFSRLLRQAVELATEDPGLRAQAIKEGLRLLDREFSTDKTSIEVAVPLHRLVKAITGNPDPYRSVKEAEVNMVRELRQAWGKEPEEDLRSCLAFAVRGNCIDFFRDLTTIKAQLAQPVEFTIDHRAALERKLKTARGILYLADNTGEVFFDLPLVRRLEGFAPVTYVVKESPIQNDVTLADLEKLGLAQELPRTITTGTDTPGVLMDMASPQFRAEFEAADIVLAKGMGYWETLSELPASGKVFHLLKAKCQPVADSLGVALDSYVALLR